MSTTTTTRRRRCCYSRACSVCCSIHRASRYHPGSPIAKEMVLKTPSLPLTGQHSRKDRTANCEGPTPSVRGVTTHSCPTGLGSGDLNATNRQGMASYWTASRRSVARVERGGLSIQAVSPLTARRPSPRRRRPWICDAAVVIGGDWTNINTRRTPDKHHQSATAANVSRS
jgi:hypothetical protein